MAMAEEEIIRQDLVPILSSITGPYSWESCQKARWRGLPSSWCKFPIIGSFGGFGGSLGETMDDLLDLRV